MHSLDTQAEPYASQQLEENIALHDKDVPWVREGTEGVTVDAHV